MAGTSGRSGHRFTAREVLALRARPGIVDAASDLAATDATLLADLTWLRSQVGELAAAVLETVRLRRRAVDRLGPQVAAWWLTEEALQQASPALVARHRWSRLAGRPVHDLTCSIGADLVWAPDGSIGSDLDPVRVLMAAGNLPGRPVFVADALTRTSRGLLGYADPARRSDGRRRLGVDTLPSLADLDAAHAHRPPVLRMPPGIDHARLARPGETEIASLDGSVREAVLWPAECATVDPGTAGYGRRATVLRTDGSTETVTSAEPDDVAVTAISRYLIEPDGAVIRAGLVRHWAARHGLTQLDPHLAYLTGDTPVPSVRAFEVIDSAPLAEKTVRNWLRRDGVGTLEIKQRGTAVDPDALRRRLRPALSGDTRCERTLVVARIGRAQHALWCRAVPAASSS